MSKGVLGGHGERRSGERLKVNFRIQLVRADCPEVEGVVTDLSPDGCFVKSKVEVQEGDLVKLRFDVPGHGDLTVWGDVVFRVKDKGFGVRFAAFSQGGARDKLAAVLGGQAGE